MIGWANNVWQAWMTWLNPRPNLLSNHGEKHETTDQFIDEVELPYKEPENGCCE